MKRSRTAWAVPALLALVLLGLGFPSLAQYNVTWDEALGDFFFGERYLSFFTTLRVEFLDFESEPYPDDHVPYLSVSPFRNRPWEYYPFANMLAAATSRIFFSWLGVVDPFDGFHAVNLLLGAAFLILFYRFAAFRFGELGAIVATGLLFLSPRVVCHMLANIKDFPEMVLFAAALFAFLAAYEAASVLGLIGAGAVWGLALATKANALFVLPLLALFVLLDQWCNRGHRPWRGGMVRLAASLCAAALLGAGLMIALWPYLWSDPIGRFARHLDYISGQIFQVRAESVVDATLSIFWTTPPVFLLFVLLGLPGLLLGMARGERTALLLGCWIAVVLGRLYLPNAVNFDGVRHFLELFPALALVAGSGAGQLAAWSRRRLAFVSRRYGGAAVATAIAALALLPPAVALLRIHPHEIAYWNVFSGGLDGARERGVPQAGDYWGMSYRQGLRWLNENAAEGSVLAVPVVQHAVTLVAPQRLRHDIGLVALTVPFRPEIEPQRLAMLRQLATQRPVYVMFVIRDDWENELMRDCRERLEPVAEWRVDGVPILQIYDYGAAD